MGFDSTPIKQVLYVKSGSLETESRIFAVEQE